MLFTWVLFAQLLIPAKQPAPVAPYVAPPRTGAVWLKYHTLTLAGVAPLNGDDDGYADAGETNDLRLTFINNTSLALTNVVVTMATTDTTVDCLNPYQVTIPSVDAAATFTTPPFRIKIADGVNRTSVDNRIEANLTVTMRADQFDVLSQPIRITLPLDLDLSSGFTGTWFEDFETGLGLFSLQSLDAGKNSLVAANGMRCQYNDPDGPNSNSGGNAYCFPGFPADPPAGVSDWHVHDSTPANGGVGRAYSGTKSLHWGVHLGTTPVRDTTRFKQVDAVKSVTINLAGPNFHPELSFAQQVSLVDNRGIPGISPRETADRAVVEVNIVQANGFEGPIWTKIYPYINHYDEQGTDDFANCTFDPTDDGNTEDDYFDPSDPNRRLGPSSTCMPEYVYACQGDTDYHRDNPPLHCNADGDTYKTDGVGSWVVPAFNLQQFAGRRIKVRFLASSLELYANQTWDDWFGRDDVVADDGWYIDAVKVAPILSTAPTLTPDTKSITPIPCAACSTINASITATPASSPEPFVPVALDASASAVDACKNGPPQYTFWTDVNGNGVAGDAGDTLLRATSPDPRLTIAPSTGTTVAVVVSCINEPFCDASDGSNTAEVAVTVNCPPGIDRTAFGQPIVFDKYPQSGTIQLSWPIAASVDVVRGCLVGSCGTSLRGGGSFSGTAQCYYAGFDYDPISSISEFSSLDPGSGFYYLVRGGTPACAQTLTGYSTNEPSERPGRDAELGSGAATCP